MQNFSRNIVETVRHPLLVFDAEFRVLKANLPFYHAFNGTPSMIVGRNFFEIEVGRWDRSSLRTLLHQVVHQNESLADLEIDYECSTRGRRILVLPARRIVGDDGASTVISTLEDDAAQRQTRVEIRRLNSRPETPNRRRSIENRRHFAARPVTTGAPPRVVADSSRELLESYFDRLRERRQHNLPPSSPEDEDSIEEYDLVADSHVRRSVDFTRFVEAVRQFRTYRSAPNETSLFSG